MSTITRPSRNAGAFVASAPDAKPRARVSRSAPRRQQITITIPPDMLQRLDALAQETGQTRAGLLLLGASRLLRDGV
jgi:hypothetical protein